MKPALSKQWVFGLHTVESALRYAPQDVEVIWIEQGRRDPKVQALMKEAQAAGVAVEFQNKREIERKAQGGNHQGAVALFAAPQTYDEGMLEDLYNQHGGDTFFLVLDGVQDPHNLGACLRTANSAGVQAVIIPKDNAVSLTPTVRKVACGAAEVLPVVQVTNLSRTLKFIQDLGVWVIGTAGEAEHDLYQARLGKGPLALVMGAEGKGMRRLTRENCDELIRIPMVGSVESLNVSVAAGVCIYEIFRQRQVAKSV